MKIGRENLENEITATREQLSNKSIWLFILAISINSLDTCSFLKPLAFAIGLSIYFYYFKLVIGERGNFALYLTIDLEKCLDIKLHMKYFSVK